MAEGMKNKLEDGKLDYAKIGLKAGLEIHQQLDVGTKLFCKCPSLLRKDKPDYEVRRKLHAVAGEEGEIDVAVAHEAGLDKTFVYQGYDDTTCLLELDENPPYFISEDALDEAIKIGLLLNCEIYPVAQIMRKMVIDGSNTSGFQRTVLIGHNGYFDMDFGRVKIDSLALEEDACRIVSRSAREDVYKLDRLGIPLVEIATAPVLDTPEKIKDCALKIGEILRACKVKRGIGTIRQDVNVSIKGHGRVEIKGFQDAKMFVKVVDGEIKRQMKEVEKGNIVGDVRNALADGKTEFLRPLPGRARMYPETDLPLLKISRSRIDRLKKELPKLREEIVGELKKKGLSEEMIKIIIKNNAIEEYGVLVKVCNDANLVGKIVVLWRNELGKKSGKSFEEVKEILTERVLEEILEKVESGDLDKKDVKDIMWKVLKGMKLEDAVKIEKAGDDELEEKIRKLINEKKGLSEKAYMGLVMKEFGGKVDGRKAMEIIRRVLGEK